MAINCYTGLPGSGKSYEVVSEVIIPQVCKGRRIVTNIDGIKPEPIYDYCVDKLGADPRKLGEVIKVPDQVVELPEFFPGEDPAVASTVQRGDVVVIDEAWKFWGAGEQLQPSHLTFFRMHRHYTGTAVDEGGKPLCCDLILMTQDINDVHRSLKRVIEFSARFKKHKALGLAGRYVANTWPDYNQRKPPIGTIQKRYDPAIFPLYDSYSGGVGAEGLIDKRISAVDWKLKASAIAAVILLPLSAVLMFREFHHVTSLHGQVSGAAHGPVFSRLAPGAVPPGIFSPGTTAAGVPQSATSAASASGLAPAIPADASPQLRARYAAFYRLTGYAPPTPPPPPVPSPEWRVAGIADLPSGRAVLLADQVGRLREVSPSTCSFAGADPDECRLDGSIVTAYTGHLLGGSGGSSSSSTSSSPAPTSPPAPSRAVPSGLVPAGLRSAL